MGPKIVLALILIGALSITYGYAQSKNTVLTPTALYDKIEKLELKHSKVLKVLLKQAKRISNLEDRLALIESECGIPAPKSFRKGEESEAAPRKPRTEMTMILIPLDPEFDKDCKDIPGWDSVASPWTETTKL